MRKDAIYIRPFEAWTCQDIVIRNHGREDVLVSKHRNGFYVRKKKGRRK